MAEITYTRAVNFTDYIIYHIPLDPPRTDVPFEETAIGFAELARSPGAAYGIKIFAPDKPLITHTDLDALGKAILEFVPARLFFTNPALPGEWVKLIVVRHG